MNGNNDENLVRKVDTMKRIMIFLVLFSLFSVPFIMHNELAQNMEQNNTYTTKSATIDITETSISTSDAIVYVTVSIVSILIIVIVLFMIIMQMKKRKSNHNSNEVEPYIQRSTMTIEPIEDMRNQNDPVHEQSIEQHQEQLGK